MTTILLILILLTIIIIIIIIPPSSSGEGVVVRPAALAEVHQARVDEVPFYSFLCYVYAYELVYRSFLLIILWLG